MTDTMAKGTVSSLNSSEQHNRADYGEVWSETKPLQGQPDD